MNNNNYNNLIDPEKDQIFIFHCPANVPLNFAAHLWFVCNEKGTVSRWEVLFGKNQNGSWGHLHRDRYLPFEGIEIFPFTRKWHWRGKLLATVEGETAEKMIDFIRASKENYPLLKDYSIIGNNSNTYVRWVLKHFPEVKVQLPRNAFGK